MANNFFKESMLDVFCISAENIGHISCNLLFVSAKTKESIESVIITVENLV